MKAHLIGLVVFVATFAIYYLGGGDFERGHSLGLTAFTAMFLYVAALAILHVSEGIAKETARLEKRYRKYG